MIDPLLHSLARIRRFSHRWVCGALAAALVGLAACAPSPETPQAEAIDESTQPPRIDDAMRRAVNDAPDLDTVVALLSGQNQALRERLETQQALITSTDLVPPESYRDYLVWRATVEGAAVRDFPHATGHFEAGRRLEDRGYHTEAREQFVRAVEKDPRMPEAHAGIGRTSVKLGEALDGVAAYRRALELAPDRPGWLFELGEALYAAEDDSGAREAMEAALALKPDWPRALIGLGTVHWRMGDNETAWRYLSEAREHGGEPDVQLVNLVRANLGMELEAVPDGEGALRLGPVLPDSEDSTPESPFPTEEDLDPR